MSKIEIVKNKSPTLNIMPMVCDNGLDPKLNEYELTKHLNKHSSNCFLGKPSSGKTTLLNALFVDKNLLYRVYDTIYLFQPRHSRSSMKDDIWEKGVRDENKFSELTADNLTEVLETIKAEVSEDKKHNSCIVFDDMTAYLQKDKNIITLLKDMMFNRRHYHISIFFLVQSLKSVPLQVRMMFENLFVFRVSKDTMQIITDEYLEEIKKENIPRLVKLVYDEPHNFLFIHVGTQRMFKNFDEIKFS